jgi:TetR/AcrR family transcriptional repressor of nem operon
MRVTREKAAENRARIVAKASQLFREKGFDAVGVDAIMDAAGLTHGGFYRHFRSKEDLVAEAVAYGLATGAELQAGHASLETYVSSYLSPRHRDDPGAGCMMAALAADIARQGPGVRDRLTADLPDTLDRLAARIGGEDPAARREQAIATVVGMVGALVLARAVNDRALSDEILAAARKVFGPNPEAAGATPSANP